MQTLQQASEGADMAGLAETALSSLRAFFDQADHNPSADHWEALGDVARTLETMADGTCPPKILLSSIDPGGGKTQTVVHFAQALVASPRHQDAGMIVCVGRIAEAEALAAQLQSIRSHFAVLVQEGHSANALGGAVPEAAQILITTQQRIERATNGRPFEEVTPLHFKGRPRQVRAWDEAFLPGVAIALNYNDLGFLFVPLQRLSLALHAAVVAFFVQLTTTQTGDLIEVPDFEAQFGVSVHDVIAAIPNGDGRLRDDQRATAQSIFILAGKTARIWRDNRDGSAILSYQDTLPDDIKPLLVLDASGRVRHTYSDLEKHRGLKRLKAAPKDYSPLRVHVWRRGGGKASFTGDGGDEIAKGIATTIATKPTEPWLVVVHKPGRGIADVDRRIRRHLSATTAAKVRTITWGQHMAVNDYQDVPNVILAGTLFMRESHYVALTHLVQDRPTAPGLVSNDDIRRTRIGEHANHVLQALCRGRVRKLNGTQCLPMDAYIVAASASGIPDVLPGIFPGCQVTDWSPLGKKLTGRVARALETVRTSFAAGAPHLTYGEIAARVGADRKDFKREIVASPAWRGAMTDLGLEEAVVAKRGERGLRRVVANGMEAVEAA